MCGLRYTLTESSYYCHHLNGWCPVKRCKFGSRRFGHTDDPEANCTASRGFVKDSPDGRCASLTAPRSAAASMQLLSTTSVPGLAPSMTPRDRAPLVSRGANLAP